MKLNPKKYTFGIEESMFLGYKVNTKWIKVCPDKVEAVLRLPSPKCLKDVQKLNGKLTSLNRFLYKAEEKSLPFFKTLKKCTKKSDFQWTTEAEAAFKEMKKLIAALQTLTAPREKEELIVYLAAAREVMRAMLMTEREATQMPVYFISHEYHKYSSNQSILLTNNLGYTSPMLLRFTYRGIERKDPRPEQVGSVDKMAALQLTQEWDDSVEPWQLGSQDATTPMMLGTIDLYHDIFFFLILILVFVSRIFVRALWHFQKDKNPISQRIVHGTTIEILRTIFPSIIPMFISVPSFTLLYSMDEKEGGDGRLYSESIPELDSAKMIIIAGSSDNIASTDMVDRFFLVVDTGKTQPGDVCWLQREMSLSICLALVDFPQLSRNSTNPLVDKSNDSATVPNLLLLFILIGVGRLQKWSIELGEYDIQHRPRILVKGQILADFIVERPKDDSLDAPMEVKEELPDPWTLFTDESSCVDGFGDGLILTNPKEHNSPTL
ncbi:reverse transcriptase domain-containing protein [Tanacetum coccineum]|uniref:Reverse transcriptase domain-containing protein n=1 Tax=Tanacetum coccineum TaxID=301880 RepID=A0ABQ4YCY9_9ASTR